MKKHLILAAIFILSVNTLFGFGKNKVNYNTYDWTILENHHYKIYITKDLLPQSNEILSMSEKIYFHHCRTFNYFPKVKIKLLIYNNQIDFQQNNIVTGWLDENTGGFTEFLKGRVVLPYSADYQKFYHILSHELTHAFQGLIWGRGSISMYSIRDLKVPLWFIEGAAEYNSIGVDREAEMMVSDAVINGYLPSLHQLSDLSTLNPRYYFYVYKEGQLFYQYINQNYGTNAFSLLQHDIATNRSIDIALSNILGLSMNDLNENFMDYLKRRYLPTITNLATVPIKSKALMDQDSYFNMNPVYIDTNTVAFISGRMIYPSIVAYDTTTKRLSRMVKGGFSEDYLEFHYGKRNNLSVSTNGKLCFVSRSGPRDILNIYDLKTKKTKMITQRFRIINSPEISKDGKKVLFSAYEKGQADIYIYDISSKKLTRVTEDKYFDNQPRWITPSKILFVSDRRQGIEVGNLDIWIYDLAESRFELAIDTGENDEYPTVSKDGKKIAFIRSGKHPSLMIYDIEGETLMEEINPTGGIFAPSFGNGNDIIFTVYHKHSYNVYTHTLSLNKTNNDFSIYKQYESRPVPEFVFTSPLTNKSYGLELSIDNLLGAFSINSSLGTALIGMISMSDLMGDHRFQLVMDTMLQFSTNMMDYINFDLTYFYLRQRFNVGVRAFMLSNPFYEFNTFSSFINMEQNYRQTWGLFALVQYPLSTFSRFDFTLGVRGFKLETNRIYYGSNYTSYFDYLNRDTLTIAFVHDSTLADYTGPVDGIRLEASLDMGFRIFTNSIAYQRLVFDYRHYIMLWPGYTIAMRGVLGKTLGVDKDKIPFYLGGFNSIRGYDLWSFQGDTMFLFNFEFRFPLVKHMQLGFPLPINMPTIWGAIFFDIGSSVNWGDPYNLYEYDKTTMILKDLKASFGFGLRLVLMPGIKLMLDFSTPYDGRGLPDIATWKTFWQIGVDY